MALLASCLHRSAHQLYSPHCLFRTPAPVAIPSFRWIHFVWWSSPNIFAERKRQVVRFYTLAVLSVHVDWEEVDLLLKNVTSFYTTAFTYAVFLHTIYTLYMHVSTVWILCIISRYLLLKRLLGTLKWIIMPSIYYLRMSTFITKTVFSSGRSSSSSTHLPWTAASFKSTGRSNINFRRGDHRAQGVVAMGPNVGNSAGDGMTFLLPSLHGLTKDKFEISECFEVP